MKIDTGMDAALTLNSRSLSGVADNALPSNAGKNTKTQPEPDTDNSSRLSSSSASDRVTLGTYQSASVYSVQSVSSQNTSQTSGAARAISNAIANQLAVDAKEGATTQALQSRLEAGLEGFLDGYSQAVDILGGLDNLPDNVKQDTQATYSQVLQSISDLASEYGLDDPAAELNQAFEKGSDQASNDVTQVDSDAVLGAVLDNNVQLGGFQQKTFDFALHTADGDTVNIKISAQSAASYAQSGSGSAFAAMSESSYELDIVGELDSDEQKAIGDLLNSIGELSRTFYDGDIGKAFNDAQSLGFDSKEIAGFALTLTYSEYTQQNTGSPQDGSVSKTDVLNNVVTQLSDFIKQLDIIKQNAENFAINNRSITDIFTSLNQNSPDVEQAGKTINTMLNEL